MGIFLINFVWLFYNLSLAFISIIFGLLMLRTHRKLLKFLYFFLWLIFLPNTIYLLTDITHLFEDWVKVDPIFRVLITIQYSIFLIAGILTFIYGVHLFEKLINKKSILTSLAILILNFAVGFGVVLGGIERTNSWDVFIDPMRVINDTFTVLSSPELIILSIEAGLLSNLVYFLLGNTAMSWIKHFKK